MAFAILVSMLVSFTLTPMLSARWIKMRPRREDAEGHEIEQESSKESRFFRPLDQRLCRHPAVVAPSLGRRGDRGARPLEQRPAVHGGEQELPAERRPVRVRGRPSRPEGTAIDATEIIANRIAGARSGSCRKSSSRW